MIYNLHLKGNKTQSIVQSAKLDEKLQVLQL